MTVRCRAGIALLAAVIATLALGAASAGAATSLPTGFQEKTLANTFNAAGESAIVDVAWAPDGRMFVADRAGMVFVQNPGALPGDHPLLLDISDHVNNGPATDRGLLGIAVDKNFATNHWLYLLYTYDKDTTDDNGWQVSTLTRVTVNPNNTVVGGATSPTETTILGQIPDTFGTDPNVGVCGAPSNTNQCIPSEGESHSIGTVRVADDGTLFVGTGDGNDYTIVDPLTFNDNNPQTYRGKIMHIDTDGNGLSGHPFCPGDGTLTDVCTKIYAEGLRNPFRFTLRPGGGLAIGDVGENAWEEFDLANGGEDFGWPCWEGNGHTGFQDSDHHRYDTTSYCEGRYAAPDTTTKPVFAWGHIPYLKTGPDRTQCSVNAPRGNTSIGGPTYMGDQYPAGYRGTIFFADYMCEWISRADMSGGSPTMQPFASGWENGVDLESAPPDGNLAYIADNEVREVVYGPGNHKPAVAPTASPTDGSAPLTVAFDAHGSDPDINDTLTYDWDFGDGSAHGSGASPSHSYTQAGNYTATVSADDGRGMTATATVPVTVTAAPGAPLVVPPTPASGVGGVKARGHVTKLQLLASVARLAAHGVAGGSFTSAHSLRKLDVSLWRGHANASSCRWWSKRSGELKRGNCSQPHWMFATLHRHGSHYTWKLRLGGSLPRGSYTLVIQAVPRSKTLAPSARLHKTLRLH